ncbi:MAG: acyl-CoA/acyl-ACP dehydrogenase, partial [Deltaproteobacteria bacterium]|nr:acyl-CoA/acyl-ACP dehydrogenase [Deltaproteobacteria bacterium]
MPFRDLDFNLTDEEKSIRDTVRKFGAEVMRPAGIELDKLADPADVIAEGSVLWDVFKKYREMDFHKRVLPKTMGGMAGELSPMASFLIGEEQGYADAGLAISLGVAGMPFAYCAMSPDPELQSWARDYAEDYDCKLIGCWAITEPDHGGDWSLGGEDPACGPSCKAVLKGDEYIITGQKSAWVSNGTIASHAVLHVSLDPSRGMRGQGLAIIRLDLPGISRGAPLDKIGQRPLNQGEIFFDEVKIPKNWMVLTPDPAREPVEGGLSGPNGSMAVTFGGLAKAAFDEA